MAMTAYFVTRHPGAEQWARRLKIDAVRVDHLDIGTIVAGDLVLGTLPIHLAAEVIRRGARYKHLEIDIPREVRGRDLSADDMERFGARLQEYRVERVAE
jgi:CRISPR-associated protein Csx16